MYISPQRQVIFVHIHKCAGSSVESAFSEQLLWNDILLGSSDYGERMSDLYGSKFGLHKHSSASEIVRVIGKHEWGGYYSWATVRNPFDRIVSLYRFCLSLADFGLKSQGVKLPDNELDRADWLQSYLFNRNGIWSYPLVRAALYSMGFPDAFSRFIRSPYFEQDAASATQVSRLTDDKGNLLVSEVIDVRELDARWRWISSRCGIKYKNLRWENVTQQASGSKLDLYRKDEDAILIANKFAEDFSAFGYDPQLRYR